MAISKKTYTRPSLITHGNVETLTQGNKTGTSLDGNFNAGTPANSITFS